MEKRNFIAFVLSAFLICLFVTVMVACDKDNTNTYKNSDSQKQNEYINLLDDDIVIPSKLSQDETDATVNPDEHGENQDNSLCGLPLLNSVNEDITVTVADVTRTSIKYRLDTDIQGLYTGAAYYIEVLKDGFWQDMQATMPKEEMVWNMLAYNIPGEYELDWSFLYGQLPAGEYRIVKQISGDIEVPYVWIYFTIAKHSSAKIFRADMSVRNQITDYTKGEENQKTLDIHADDARVISEILLNADWSQFDYAHEEAYNRDNGLNYYHIWADGFMVDYFMDEGKFEAIDFSKTSMYSSKFPSDRLRLTLTDEQKEVIDGIIKKHFPEPSRTACY